MECTQIKKNIPKYVNHVASAEEVQQVEEHLCTCDQCRDYLGELLEEKTDKGKLSIPDENTNTKSSTWDLTTFIIILIALAMVGFLFFLFVNS
jgi:predicted anti-sigma-YlaC factor YlaD